jgi:hypothetical protein
MQGEHERPLGLARGAEQSGLAGICQDESAAALGAVDPCEAVMRVSAFEEAEDALMDDLLEEPVLPLVSLFVASLEVLPLM